MAFKKRTATLITGTTGGSGTGTATIDLGLGAAYGRIFKVEFKGDDANVDTNNTLQLVDADGRIIFAATALDGGTDDATTKMTEQSYSTVGVGFYVGPVETDVYDAGGDPSANTEGTVPGVIARSPVTINIASGTDGDVHRVHLFVEV